MTSMKIETTPILITCGDGSVAVMHFVLRDGRGIERTATDEELLREISKAFAATPEKFPATFRRITAEEIPADRTYRDAWKDTGTVIEHDMVKARTIHRDRLRLARAPMLTAFDVEYQKADELGPGPTTDAVKESIAARKQSLRDVPAHPDIEAAQSIEDLKKVWPLLSE